MKKTKSRFHEKRLKLEAQMAVNPFMKATRFNIRTRFGHLGTDLDYLGHLGTGLEDLRNADADISKPFLYLYPRGGLISYFMTACTERRRLCLGILFFNSKGEIHIRQERFLLVSRIEIIIPEEDIIKVKLRNRILWKKIIIKTKKKRYSFITLPKMISVFPVYEYNLIKQEWPYFVRYMKDVMKRRK